MSHTNQSKPLSQSDELWFKKSNYPDKWLSAKSKEIINKIKQKQMKKLIFTLLLPLMSFAQTDALDALIFQNSIRSYFNVDNLAYSPKLALEAQYWAEHLANVDDFVISDDPYGESLYWIEKNHLKNKKQNVLLSASMNWILDSEDMNTYNQMIYDKASQIGFGIAETIDGIYVVAKYDKLYE
jgi:hypothetical protein